jgi:hypothetical protein
VIATGEVNSVHTVAACVTRAYQDVVEIWDDDIQDWDTLYWYGAVPGSTWKRPFDTGTCGPDERIVVLDTGHVIMSGVTLAYWDVEQQWEGGITGPTRIIERLGWLPELLTMPACYSGEELVGLRCYSDEEMAVNLVDFPCRSLVGMDEVQGTHQIILSPNPGTTHITLSRVEGSLPPGPHTITLFDATGRMVLEQRTTEERPMISTEHLPSGLYRIVVRDEQGAMMGTTWVKER